jgi:hypothetical protein
MTQGYLQREGLPGVLQSAKPVYVGWVETSGKGAQNLGQLKTFSGIFSNTLKASMQAASPFKPTRIFITADDKANIEYPSSRSECMLYINLQLFS